VSPEGWLTEMVSFEEEEGRNVMYMMYKVLAD
jgi:hypothetical protein